MSICHIDYNPCIEADYSSTTTHMLRGNSSVNSISYPDSITNVEHEAWRKYRDRLSTQWKKTPSDCPPNSDEPNRLSIEFALKLLQIFCEHDPKSPPSYIVDDPSGGIAIYFITGNSKTEIICFNNGKLEFTLFDGTDVVFLETYQLY